MIDYNSANRLSSSNAALLWEIPVIERSLKDSSWEDNCVFTWGVVGIHCLRGHGPPEEGKI